jgi:hypothetical protein
MTNFFKKLGVVAGLVFLLLLTAISFANASDFGPRRGRGDRPSYSVAEPTAIVLLAAGLVSLGFYAKKKRGKKQ